MKHIVRVRRMVSLAFDETNNPTNPVVKDSTDQAPTYQSLISDFSSLKPSYDDDLANIAMTMATQDDYLKTRKSRDSHHSQLRVVVTGKGLKLLTPTYFTNELAGSVGKISPLVTVILSIVAIAISIIALKS